MVSRRRALQVGAALLASASGCLGSSQSSESESPTRTTTREQQQPSATPSRTSTPTSTPPSLPDWTPEWSIPFDGWYVLGVTTADGELFVTLSRDGGSSAVVAVDPQTQAERWRTTSQGEALSQSHASYHHIARNQWGVSLDDDTVYTVAGRADARRWSTVHALERSSGDRRWKFRRERELTVAGVSGDLVVIAGTEFFPPPDRTAGSHETPEEPLSTTVFGVNAATGEVRWRRTVRDLQEVSVGDAGIGIAAGDRLLGLGTDGTTRLTYESGPAARVEVGTERLYYLSGRRGKTTLHGISPDGTDAWEIEAPISELRLGNERLYAGGRAVLAVAPDGTVQWRDDTPGSWFLFSPDAQTVYTRSGSAADAATAYAASGKELWTFEPASNNAWPAAATKDVLAVTAMNGRDAKWSNTVYAVGSDGEAEKALGIDGLFDAAGTDGMVYLADQDSSLIALQA